MTAKKTTAMRAARSEPRSDVRRPTATSILGIANRTAGVGMMPPMSGPQLTGIDEETSSLLQRFGFERGTFEKLVARLSDPGLRDNTVRGTLEVPAPRDVTPLPPVGSAERARLDAIGTKAIAAGKVGAVVLAGGMATRFGGVVKAGVPAVLGRTFLDLKLSDLSRLAARTGGRVPCWLMTSFATDEEVTRLARAYDSPSTPVATFPQMISLRVFADGTLATESDGTLSPYAPGHGDLTFALRRSGALARFRESGGELLFMSNVDNLGATLDPAVIGAHLESGVAITAEVVRKEPGDKGGAPARVDGAPQIVEAFRFPKGFDQDRIPVFNTNTFVLDAAAIDRDFELTYFVVEKNVEGKKVIQFERLVGELTAFLPTRFLEVLRSGPDGRFQPVKDPEELARRAPDIEALLRARGVV
jgi:UTP--glucose-1-phosphate uridylyltransferase